MYKGDLSRELYPNFTYQSCKKCILVCIYWIATSFCYMTWFVLERCNDFVLKIAASSAAMTDGLVR